MEIELAPHSGFCFGVKRAVKCALQVAREQKKSVYCLGPLIHNPQVVNKLKQEGVRTINDLSQIERGTVIIRSHGVHPDLVKEARQKGLKVVDATCPFVRKAQQIARSLKNEGYGVVVVGEKEHPEVKAIIGHADDDALVIEVPEGVNLLQPHRRIIGVLSQTTQSKENFKKIIANLIGKIDEMKVFNTICESVRKRQEATFNLAGRVELMLVIGGYNSGNTRRLAQICKETGTETHHVEIADEIDLSWLKGKTRIGVSAGASTPDWIIEGVMERLRTLSKSFSREKINLADKPFDFAQDGSKSGEPVEPLAEVSTG